MEMGMDFKRRVMMWGGTIGCALGIGFVMQSTAQPERVMHAPSPVAQLSVRAPNPSTDVDDYAMLDVTGIILTSALTEIPEPDRLTLPLQEGERLASMAGVEQAAPEDPAVPILGCQVAAEASVLPMARVELSISAPCYGGQRVTIHHSGLAFTEVTDAEGALDVIVPALSRQAVFVISLDNGKGNVVQARVDDLHAYDRVAVQWAGPVELQVHAREFGADYGGPGHVWAASAAKGAGAVVRLGRTDTLSPKLAQVYTFPTAYAGRNGEVSISIEAEVTADNCARDITAQSLELRGEGPLRTRDLMLSMPNCDATGDFLVLNNLIEDLKIAAK